MGLGLISQACNGRDGPKGFTGASTSVGSGSGSGGSGGFQGGPDPCDLKGECGEHVHDVRLDVPNLYFVLDRSGSMDVPVDSSNTAYDVVRDETIALVAALGSLINVGAALFPRAGSSNACAAGVEVLPVTKGDPPGDYVGDEGPTTTLFRQATKTFPVGGTPISATLEQLAGPLAELEGRTIVMLLTDGGPNCNSAAMCPLSDCLPALEALCDPGVNCCAPGDPDFGPESCLDRPASIEAVADLYDNGIDVYVIGITGSEFFGDVLDAMAEAGGTAQEGATKYHRVDDFEALGDVFAQIAAEAISCDIDLADPPAEEGFTNVYLDCELVEQSMYGGWIWLDEDTITLTGSSCDKLKAGAVEQVKIITGCPTELPK